MKLKARVLSAAPCKGRDYQTDGPWKPGPSRHTGTCSSDASRREGTELAFPFLPLLSEPPYVAIGATSPYGAQYEFGFVFLLSSARLPSAGRFCALGHLSPYLGFLTSLMRLRLLLCHPRPPLQNPSPCGPPLGSLPHLYIAVPAPRRGRSEKPHPYPPTYLTSSLSTVAVNFTSHRTVELLRLTATKHPR